MEPNNMQINYQDLQHMLHLLQMAESSDNNSQAQVFQTLKSVEENPLSYVYLAMLFANTNISLNLRKLAGLTMSSALKRNHSILHFQLQQLNQLKTHILSQNAPQLQNIKSMIASTLITRQNFDYGLFNYLIESIEIQPQNVSMIIIILEDLKYSSENYSIFQEDEFSRSFELIYKKAFAIFATIKMENINNHNKVTQWLKCLNLITFHCPTKLHIYLQQYLQSIIKSFLILAQQQPIPNEIKVLALTGLNQIFATKFSLVSAQIIEIVLNFNSFEGNSQQINKCWTNIIIQLVQNDFQGHLQHKLPLIMPRLFQGLTFTEKDQANIKQDIELQYNPYNQDSESRQQPQLEDQNTVQQNHDTHSGYTLRKLSFQLLDKISVTYSQNLWGNWLSFTKQRLSSQNVLQCQTAVAFIATIAQTCSESMQNEIELLVLYLIQRASPNFDNILRATSIWALEKLLPNFQLNYQIIISCLNLISQGVSFNNSKGGVTQMMVQQASVSFLDGILQKESIRNKFDGDTLQRIIQILVHGLNIFRGRALISVFKAISTIFQQPFSPHVLNHQYFDLLVQQLNRKRIANANKDSIVCPLLECLITACQSKTQLFSKYNQFYFKSVLLDLRNKERVAFVLRCIDFMSSLINHSGADLAPFVVHQEYLAQIYELLNAQDKQIRHFTYGLISDTAKKYDISSFVLKFVQRIAQTMNQKNLTSLCNALTSLTDLLSAYPTLTLQYSSEILEKVTAIIAKQRLQLVFSLNFSRLYGRLSLLNPEYSKSIILRNNKIISAIFLSLRTREILKITSDAFRGLIITLGLLSQQQLIQIGDGIGYVLDALICYPLSVNSTPQNQQLLLLFSQFTKHLHRQLGNENWAKLLNIPIFLPASIKTIQRWLV